MSHNPSAGGVGKAAAAGAAQRSRGVGPPTAEQQAGLVELVRSTQTDGVAEAILGDPAWPRVAGQLGRVQPKAEAAGVDLRQVLTEVTGQLERCTDADTHSPAGWMIWVVHHATAERGVQLVAQARSGTGLHPPAPRRRGRATSPGPTRQVEQEPPTAQR